MATGKSLFKVNYGYHPDITPGIKTKASFQTPTSADFISTMQTVHAEAKCALEKAAAQMKAQYDKESVRLLNIKLGTRSGLTLPTYASLDQRKSSMISARVPSRSPIRKACQHTP